MGAPKVERQLNLVAFLLKVGRSVTLSEIRKVVVGYNDPAAEGAVARRFERDKVELAALGVPIEYTAPDALTEGGYFIDRAHFFLPAISLCAEERLLLHIVSQLAPAPTANEYSVNLFWAIQKLLFNRPAQDDVAPAVALEKEKTPASSDLKRFSLIQSLARAAALRAPVRFTYFSIEADRNRRRHVRPYGLGTYRGSWYLVAFCLAARDVRVFKTGRITGSVRVGDPGSFEVPDDFRISSYIGPRTWSTDEPREREVIAVAFSPTVSWMVEKELDVLGSRTLENGWRAMRFFNHNRGMLIRWLLSLAPFFKVLEPEDFRLDMKRHLERTAGLYEDG